MNLTLSLPAEKSTVTVLTVAELLLDRYAKARHFGTNLSRTVLSPLHRLLRSGAQYFFTAIDLGFSFAFVILLTPVLALLLSVLTILLMWVNAILWGNLASTLRRIERMSVEEAIEQHLLVERLFHSATKLKKSKLLFSTPVIGSLFKSFYSKLSTIEVALKNKAYPKLGYIPDDLLVDNYNPNDPWQETDSGELDPYEKMYMTK